MSFLRLVVNSAKPSSSYYNMAATKKPFSANHIAGNGIDQTDYDTDRQRGVLPAGAVVCYAVVFCVVTQRSNVA